MQRKTVHRALSVNRISQPGKSCKEKQKTVSDGVKHISLSPSNLSTLFRDSQQIYKKSRLRRSIGTNFCDYNRDFYKKLSLGYINRKLREAWRLVFSSALPSKGDGEPYTDILQPQSDFRNGHSHIYIAKSFNLPCNMSNANTYLPTRRSPVINFIQ